MKKYYFILLLFLLACNKSPLDFMVKEGDLHTEVRMLSNYDSILIMDLFDVKLVQDSTCFAEITAGENILPYVKTNVTNAALYLENHIKGRWARPYHHPQITLHFKKLKYIRMEEASNLSSSDSIITENLDLFDKSPLSNVDLILKGTFFNFSTSYSSTGTIKLKGKVNRANFFPGGTSIFDASELSVDSALIFQNSMADMKVWVTKNIMELRFFKDGKVYVKGNPPLRNLSFVKDTSLLIFQN